MIDKQIHTPEECADLFPFLDTLEVEYHKPYKGSSRGNSESGPPQRLDSLSIAYVPPLLVMIGASMHYVHLMQSDSKGEPYLFRSRPTYRLSIPSSISTPILLDLVSQLPFC